MSGPLVTVVVPVWQDEDGLARALRGVGTADDRVEVVVACALGEESRYAYLREQFPTVRWISAPRGRGIQMNAGAAGACGRWLLFLHADSTLSPAWIEAVREADRRADVVAGAFALALGSRDWRARVIEAGVRLRVTLFGMPYGDQALFVRRAVFERLGGFRDLPLMEDVDFVRRIKPVGRMLYSRLVTVTSARRWERDGWLRRSGQNIALATGFLLGVSPARLARRYLHRKPVAVVMMARAPWTGGKTRLVGDLDAAQSSDLRQAIFLDTLDALRAVPGTAHVIACEPAEASEQLRGSIDATVDVIAQRGGDLGQRMANVFEDVFRLGARSVVVIGSDLPDLPPALLQEAVAALRRRNDTVVLGPASDGGYYLIGMNRPRPELFAGIDWSTPRVLAQTVDRLKAQHARLVLLSPWTDLDTPADLRRLIARAGRESGTRTRAWAAANLT